VIGKKRIRVIPDGEVVFCVLLGVSTRVDDLRFLICQDSDLPKIVSVPLSFPPLEIWFPNHES
jgi:hypothetical protein